jgi:hypothetical protein
LHWHSSLSLPDGGRISGRHLRSLVLRRICSAAGHAVTEKKSTLNDPAFDKYPSDLAKELIRSRFLGRGIWVSLA